MEENIYNPERVKGLFDSMSSSYERMNYFTSFGFSIRWRKQFLNPFPKTKEKVEIIDLMTGMGETWGAVKQKFPNANLTVLDFSDGMLLYAKKKSKEKFANQITVLQQDVLNSELQSNYFDFVTCAFGLKTFNLEQIAILANEVERILKDGGQFSFIEISKPSNKILHFFYRIHLKLFVPFCGRLLLGNPEEYKMLWKYTNQYENSKKAMQIFAEKGLAVHYNSYFFGCATGICGQKKNK